MNVTVRQKFAPSSDDNGRVKHKLKACLVGGGDCQDRSIYSRADTSSPTASTSAIMIVAQLAAAEGRHIISLDIGSAYLYARIPKDDPSKLVCMAIAPNIAEILIDIEPHTRSSYDATEALLWSLTKPYMDVLRAPSYRIKN
jgi:hypothetical protein